MGKISQQEALQLVAEALNEPVEHLKKTNELASLNGWDSMGVLMLMAEFDERFGLIINENKLNSLIYFGDILKLLSDNNLLEE